MNLSFVTNERLSILISELTRDHGLANALEFNTLCSNLEKPFTSSLVRLLAPFARSLRAASSFEFFDVFARPFAFPLVSRLMEDRGLAHLASL